MRNGSRKWSNEFTSSLEILMMRQSQIGDCISNRELEFELIQSDSQLKVESFTHKVWIWIISNLLSAENIWIFSTKIDSAFSWIIKMIRIIYRFMPNPVRVRYESEVLNQNPFESFGESSSLNPRESLLYLNHSFLNLNPCKIKETESIWIILNLLFL